MSDIASLNQHQKKALVIQLYEQGKTRRQIAEVVHMGFKDIADVINTLAKRVFRSTNQRNQKIRAHLGYSCKVNNLLKWQ